MKMNIAHEYGERPVMGCECVVCSGRRKWNLEAHVDGRLVWDCNCDQCERRRVDFHSELLGNKSMPVCTGFLDYFPDAIREVSKVSLAGNKQHNIDGPLTWDRSKSADHADCLVRHQLLRGTRDTDGQLHSAKVAWRALAQLQMELEQEKAAS